MWMPGSGQSPGASRGVRSQRQRPLPLPTRHFALGTSRSALRSPQSSGPFRQGPNSGDQSAVEPPGPIPNPEVKRRSADGSGTTGPVRVGRRQVNAPSMETWTGLFFAGKMNSDRLPKVIAEKSLPKLPDACATVKWSGVSALACPSRRQAEACTPDRHWTDIERFHFGTLFWQTV